MNGNTVSFSVSDVTLALTDETYKVAITQTHATYDTPQGNRTEVMKELTLAHFKKDPAEVLGLLP